MIKQENKAVYYSSLAQADNGELIPIIEYISETVKHSLIIYFKAINGEDINEPDDLDKEIALFRKEIGVKSVIKLKRNNTDITRICFDIFYHLGNKLNKFSDIFNSNSTSIIGDNPSIGINFNLNSLPDYDKFLERATDKLKTANSVNFEHKYINDIYQNNISISVHLLIDFKTDNYIISHNGKRIIKYYDEAILDTEIFTLIKEIVRNLMIELKKIKK